MEPAAAAVVSTFAAPPPGAAPAPPADAATLALSLAQHEVWLDQQAWPDSAHLNIGGGAVLIGPLELTLFELALARLVAENEALRLAPLADGGQRLLAHHVPRLERHDLSASAQPLAAMRQWWQARMAEPFALDGTPPWRFALLRVNDELHGLTIQFHHLVMDGWGTSQVMRRWSDIYNALQRGEEPPATQAPGYRAFIEESLAYRSSPAFARDAAYWTAQLPQLPAPLIERRHARGPQQTLAAARIATQRIARTEYEALRDTATARGASPFALVLAALALYFARTAERSEVVVGVPSLNRGGQRYRATLGMFVGVSPLVLQVGPGMTAEQLVAGVAAALRGALRHPRYPLSELGRTLQAIRNNRDGLFDVLLSFERQDYDVSFGSADLVDSRQLFSGTARFPLGVTVCEFHPEQDLELVLEGSATCFADDEVELLGRRLWHVAQAIAAAPQARVDAIDILPPEERWALVHGLHKDVARHPTVRTFIRSFEHQAALRPEATALVWDHGSVDYATLDARAARLAGRLAALGAGRNAVVALAIERSPAMVLALLAIAKAGAAFLPLETDAPLARLRDILAQSEAVALLIEPAFGARLGSLHPRTVAVDWQAAPAQDDEPAGPLPEATADDLAYVLFTSGSTGRPKGVLIQHATLSRRLAWLARSYAVDWRDRSAQATQLSFDPSLIELLLPLAHGASVALPPPGRLKPESLAEFAARHGVTIMAFVPSTLARFLDGAAGRDDLRLRVACCGGEVLPPELANRFLERTGGRLFNVYGPTEAAIFATAWECQPQEGAAPLPIGRPVDDTRVYVLDGAGRPQPFGVAGEIHLGGEALARGYLTRPELDAQAFVPDPFVPGARLYRTGDRGWLGSEGNLYFLGRADRQVKLRGYRIELGEIEAALLGAPGVRQAAVQLVERQGKPALHAWVAGEDAQSADRLQRTLRERLPDYMIPAGISVLAELPLSATGKIDLPSLPAPDSAARGGAAARAPASELERALLALWQEVLGRDGIRVHDNFFDLGGDSLAAINILTALEQRIGRRVPMYFLTEYPSIEELAGAIEAQAGGPGMLVRLGAASGRPPLYLAASGHGDLLRFQNLARELAEQCELHMLQPPADDSIASIADLARLYAARIEASGAVPSYLAGFSVGGITALETARLLQQRGNPVRGLFLIDTVFPSTLWGRPRFWRLLGWVVRHLHVQDLSMNGRRLGAMFNDPGLVDQVMALDGYRPQRYDGPTVLVKSSGLVGWERWLFRPWRRLLEGALTEAEVSGMHGSMFEPGNVGALAAAIARHVEAAP